MDLDGDGCVDVISGSNPGELYLFRGSNDGTFAAREKLTDRRGDLIKTGEATAPFAIDWDRDGDVDLVIGNKSGYVHLVPNESGGRTLSITGWSAPGTSDPFAQAYLGRYTNGMGVVSSQDLPQQLAVDNTRSYELVAIQFASGPTTFRIWCVTSSRSMPVSMMSR